MAEVSMDLAELDAMRKNIEKLELSLRVEKEDRIIVEASLQGEIKNYENSVPTVLNREVKLRRNFNVNTADIVSALREMSNRSHNYWRGISYEEDLKESVRKIVENHSLWGGGFGTYSSSGEDEVISDTKKYLNFDVIKESVKEDLDEKMKKENIELRVKAGEYDEDILRLKTSHKNYISDLRDANGRELDEIDREARLLKRTNDDATAESDLKYTKKVKELDKKYENKVRELNKKHDDLLNDKKEKKKDTIIEELLEKVKDFESKIEVINNKGFFERLFGQ